MIYQRNMHFFPYWRQDLHMFFYFKCLFVYFYLRAGERDWLIDWSSILSFTLQICTILRTGAGRNQELGTLVSHMGGRDPRTGVICCFLRCISRKLGQKWRSQKLNQHCDMGCGHPKWRLNLLPHNTYPKLTFLWESCKVLLSVTIFCLHGKRACSW